MTHHAMFWQYFDPHFPPPLLFSLSHTIPTDPELDKLIFLLSDSDQYVSCRVAQFSLAATKIQAALCPKTELFQLYICEGVYVFLTRAFDIVMFLLLQQLCVSFCVS